MTTIGGRYQLGRRLDASSEREAYEAQAPTGLPVTVVIGGARVAREAAIVREVDLPCMPDFVETFTTEIDGVQRHVLVHAPLDGPSLAEALEGPPIATEAVLDLAHHLLFVLEDLHGRATPVIHGDLTAAHVHRSPRGGLLLTGIGALNDGDQATMAPEQRLGTVLPAADQYGLGTLVVHLLTGRPPPPDPDAALPLAPEVRAWLDRLLAPEPRSRFSNASSARDCLERARRGGGDALVGPSHVEELGGPLETHVRYVGYVFGAGAVYLGFDVLFDLVALSVSALEALSRGDIAMLPMLLLAQGISVALPALIGLAFAYAASLLTADEPPKEVELLGIQQPVRRFAQVLAIGLFLLIAFPLGTVGAGYALYVLTRPQAAALLGDGVTVPIR